MLAGEVLYRDPCVPQVRVGLLRRMEHCEPDEPANETSEAKAHDDPTFKLRANVAKLSRNGAARDNAHPNRAQNAATGGATLHRLLRAMQEQLALGQRIAGERTRLGLTQPQAADLLGVSLRAYQDWEAGRRLPRARNLKRLREHFGIELEPIKEAVADKLDYIIERLDALTEMLAARVSGRELQDAAAREQAESPAPTRRTSGATKSSSQGGAPRGR